MNHRDCETWDYLKKIGQESQTYCPFALACLGSCFIIKDLIGSDRNSPEKKHEPPDGSARFFNRLEQTIELQNT